MRQQLDVLIVGAGFAGIYALHRMRELGLRARVLEAGEEIGGTWYWNRYPGARCDVESMQYSFSFSDEIQQEWKWKELYAPQAEILSYINFVADRLNLRNDIQLSTRVTAATFDSSDNRWTVETNVGDAFSAQYLIMATGCLSIPLDPKIKGINDFEGVLLRTSNWPKDGVDLSGKRVGIIGTGSSSIQAVPHLAQQADQLYVFQRTPNYSIPAQNRPMDSAYEHDWKDNYAERRKLAKRTRNNTLNNAGPKSGTEFSREELEKEFEKRWQAGGIGFMYTCSDITSNEDVNEIAADFVRNKIRKIVKDPKKADILIPRDYPIGAKRICVDTEYFETFNRDNVTPVDIKSNPIEKISKNGVVLSNGDTFDLDTLILATGFDAMTGALLRINISGRNGIKLADEWAAGPKTYFGIAISGFPNMFTITGPGSPSVFTNMVTSIEQHVDWIVDCMTHLQDQGKQTIEAMPDAQENWTAHGNEIASTTIFYSAASWYVGANVEGKPRIFMPYIGGADNYIDKLTEMTAEGYRGFEIS